MKRATATLAIAFATSLAPAHAQPADPPPPLAKLAVNQIWTGEVSAIGDFTPAEEADPAWEARRLEWLRRPNPKARILSRDVRWFPSLGGSRCARIVYTLDTHAPHGQTAGWAQRRDADRLSILAMESTLLEPGCGIKDRDKRHDDPKAYERRLAEEAARYRQSEVACDALPSDPATPIRIYPGTRLWAAATFDETLPFARYNLPTVNQAPWPAVVISGRRYAAVLPKLPIVTFGAFVDDGHNILIAQRIGRVNAGQGYCIQLTARQRDRIWSRTIVRQSIPAEDPKKRDRMGLSADPDHYWTIDIDTKTLADTLASALGIPPRVGP